MKLTIKTLQNTTFKVDIGPDRTVKELKDFIETEQGKDYPSKSQKLIYNGKILADENKLVEYEFDEKKFVVLMITRPPPLPKPTATTQEQTTSSSKKKDDDKSKPAMSAPSQPTTAPSTRQQQSSSTVSSTPATAAVAAPQPPTSAATRTFDTSGLTMNDTQARLGTLMRQAQFRQMQDLIQQSPHLLSSTIESLAASDPEMYNFISENPDLFVNALNHPPMAESRSNQQSVGEAQRSSSQSRGGGVPQPGGQPPVVEQLSINVSEHDKEAIERLKELGFSEYLAVQAYMACDKDEQLAANLLFQMDQ